MTPAYPVGPGLGTELDLPAMKKNKNSDRSDRSDRVLTRFLREVDMGEGCQKSVTLVTLVTFGH